MEVIKLANAEREKYGLRHLEADNELMELAQIRTEEVYVKYSHELPDSTKVSRTCYYADIINRGAQTP